MKKIYLNGCNYYLLKYSLLGPANFRNEATHERSLEVKESEYVHSKTFEFLKMILGLRTVWGKKLKKLSSNKPVPLYMSHY